jgi:hypothetical protein
MSTELASQLRPNPLAGLGQVKKISSFSSEFWKKKENAGAFFFGKPSNIALKVYQITYKHTQILKFMAPK